MRSWRINIPIHAGRNPYDQINISRECIFNKLWRLVGKKIRLEMDIQYEPIDPVLTIATKKYWIDDAAFRGTILDEMSRQLATNIEGTFRSGYHFFMMRFQLPSEARPLPNAKIMGFRLVYS